MWSFQQVKDNGISSTAASRTENKLDRRQQWYSSEGGKSVGLEITSILHSEDQVVRITEVIGVGVKFGDFWKDVVVGVVPRRRC